MVTQDILCVFPKELKSKKPTCYVLSKNSGIYKAKFKASLDVNGLITGGAILEEQMVNYKNAKRGGFSLNVVA